MTLTGKLYMKMIYKDIQLIITMVLLVTEQIYRTMIEEKLIDL